MKIFVALLVVGAMLAVANAGCCKCRANQDPFTVKIDGLTATVTVNPNRGFCGPDVKKFV